MFRSLTGRRLSTLKGQIKLAEGEGCDTLSVKCIFFRKKEKRNEKSNFGFHPRSPWLHQN